MQEENYFYIQISGWGLIQEESQTVKLISTSGCEKNITTSRKLENLILEMNKSETSTTKVECYSVMISVKIRAKQLMYCMPMTGHDDHWDPTSRRKKPSECHNDGKLQQHYGKRIYKLVGSYGLIRRNERHKIDFCKQHDLLVMNKWFKKRKIKLYTWKSAWDQTCYQIDCILLKHAWGCADTLRGRHRFRP